MEEHPDEPHGEQDAADPERVGHGIAHPHQAGGSRIRPQLGQDLLASPEGRVLVTAPEKTPRITGSGTSNSWCNAAATRQPSRTSRAAKPLSLRPELRKEGEKAGPTWMPMV